MTQVLDRDGQRQAVLRQLTAPYFAPAGLDVWTEAIDRCVREGLEILGGRERADLMGDFALPLTATVGAHVFGLPPAHAPHMMELAGRLFGHEHAQTPGMRAAHREFGLLLDDTLREKAQRPADDAIGALVRALHNGTISGQELREQAGGLLIGASGTTAIRLAYGAALLLRHPQTLGRVPAGDLVPVLEELLGPRLTAPSAVGAPLARRVAAAALPALFARFPGMRLVGELTDIVWRGAIGDRRPVAVRVLLDVRA
ncbi:hypothetical protein ACFV29_06895 [Streptomyces sp. NPDC059690]|uniref:hypothetical protein n=1 Tax=Streptomyces sp. NPDC059690 TaxID=3346907 RepID=UPI0036B6E2F3